MIIVEIRSSLFSTIIFSILLTYQDATAQQPAKINNIVLVHSAFVD
jgi:hypothetical protein